MKAFLSDLSNKPAVFCLNSPFFFYRTQPLTHDHADDIMSYHLQSRDMMAKREKRDVEQSVEEN